MAKSNPCPKCYGTGVEDVEVSGEEVETYYHCHYCDGSGIVWSRNDKNNGRVPNSETIDT